MWHDAGVLSDDVDGDRCGGAYGKTWLEIFIYNPSPVEY